ncbi:MAG: MFS transporter [Tatlockia sp.]|nr:MFS transporter [Tatlockia sp.]
MIRNTTSIKGFLVWFVCVLFYLYEFLLRTLLGTFQQPIMQDLEINSFNFALLSSTAYLFIYGLMQIPVGAAIGRFGLKKALFFASMVCVIATLGFSYSTNFSSALFFRSLMGLGSAFGFICVLFAVYDWMPYKNIALFIGLSQLLGTLGPMAAGGPLSALANNSTMTWRTIFFDLSLIGCVVAVLIVLVVEKNKQLESSFIILKKSLPLKKEILGMLRDKQVWFIAIYCAFLYFGLEYLSENECKNLLIAKGFTSTFSSYMITIAWLGFAFGSPIGGYLSDKIKRRKPILYFSAISTLLSVTAILYLPLSELQTSFVFLTFGLGVGSASVGIAIMGEQFKSDKISTGLGINNAISILFVSLLAPGISLLLSKVAYEVPYTLSDFQQAFPILILLPFLALLIVMFYIKETYGKSSKESIILNFETISE